jgi:mono/diheme cytochrome c family protein
VTPERSSVFVLAVALVGLAVLGLGAGPAWAAERDPLAPRAPKDRLEELRAMKNPVPATEESLERGRKVYRGTGSCNVCHGEDGDGNGIGASGLDPSPRNFTNTAWQKARSDGELMWVLRHGSPGSAMITVVPGLISESEAWDVINYLRSLGR